VRSKRVTRIDARRSSIRDVSAWRRLSVPAGSTPTEPSCPARRAQTWILLKQLKNVEQLADQQIRRGRPVGSPPGIVPIGFALSPARDSDLHRRERSSAAHCSASIVRPAFASSNPLAKRCMQIGTFGVVEVVPIAGDLQWHHRAVR
jgi:hypothetical protein